MNQLRQHALVRSELHSATSFLARTVRFFNLLNGQAACKGRLQWLEVCRNRKL